MKIPFVVENILPNFAVPINLLDLFHNYHNQLQSMDSQKLLSKRMKDHHNLHVDDNDSPSDEQDSSKLHSKQVHIENRSMSSMSSFRSEKLEGKRRKVEVAVPICTRAEQQQIIEEMENKKRQYASSKKEWEQEQQKLQKTELELKKAEQDGNKKEIDRQNRYIQSLASRINSPFNLMQRV